MSHELPDVVLREHGVASVLIVDDDESIRETLKDCLSDEGFTAAVVENGQQALDYLASVPVPPRLILLDLMMPIMDGWEVLNRLRMSAAFSSIPLVIISAVYGKSGRHRAPSAIPVRVLEKPIDMSALLAIVREACAPPSATTRG